MKRIDCFKAMAEVVGDALVVTGAGGNTIEWNAVRPSDGNFRVRTMGLVSSIALGMALGLPKRKVIAIDGDGSLLMNLCSLPTLARKNPPNLVHIVLIIRPMNLPEKSRRPLRRVLILLGWQRRLV